MSILARPIIRRHDFMLTLGQVLASVASAPVLMALGGLFMAVLP